jgi:hypothetical protein
MLHGSFTQLIVLSALLAACHGAKLEVDGGKVVQQVCAWAGHRQPGSSPATLHPLTHNNMSSMSSSSHTVDEAGSVQ